MEEDANNKDLVNSVIHDYEKLLREECDCTKRIIPGMTEVKSFKSEGSLWQENSKKTMNQTINQTMNQSMNH